MPQWAGSCWYYLRFTDPTNTQALFSQEASSWLPVDLYVGGQEHAVLHLLYARFWHKVLHQIGVVGHDEPFTKLVHQGMVSILTLIVVSTKNRALSCTIKPWL